jgi:hypothetical protein
MGATYTRQSSYTDGDVITAAHTNDEFNQLLAAFQASTGHTHDGTANEGGPITKLLGNTLTFGAGTAGTDITITFDGETSDGVLKWMEDEDYFEFSDDILIASTEKLQFRDTAIYINSSTDGQLDLVADTEIQIAATTVDLNGNLDVSGSLTLGGTALTSTATELNIIDGDTSATGTTLADADRVVVNDAGTMKQVALTDFETYFESALDTLSNVTTVGALNSGSITSGFGAIDNGSSAITTTGTITYGSLSDGSITITAFVDEDDMSSNSATLVPTQQSVKAYVDTQITAEDLDVTSDSGTIAIDLDSETFTIAGGEGIDTSATGNTVTIAGEDASTSNKGVASFSSDNFAVSSGAVTIKDGGVVTAKIAADAITGAKIADDAINSEHYTDGSIDTAHIADSQITTAKIADDAVTQAKIADDAVGADQLASDAVVNASIASSASIADSKLATISTAGKVALTALEIDGGTDIGADLTTSDLIVVDDGAAGTNRKAALSRVVTLMSAQGFTTDDPTALAIALG